jgi:hypothetical protein
MQPIRRDSMATARHNAIAELMNGLCRDRAFTGNEVAFIEIQIKAEKENREALGIDIETKSRQGRENLCKRIADRINAETQFKFPITAKHIHLYRQCRADEYTNRTGKCAWGFKNTRERLGYDPDTGREVV